MAVLQTSLLLMKSLNKTETPIFLSVVCSLFPKAIFLTFISKSDSILSQSIGQMLLDIMDDHGLEQMIPLPICDKNTLDLILTYFLGQFQDIHSPDKLSDQGIVSGYL